MDWDTDSLVSERRQAGGKWCKSSPPPASRLISSQSPGNDYLGRKPSLHLLLLLAQFYCQAWHYIIWNIPLENLGHLSQLCLLPASCPPICFHAQWRQSMKQRKPWCCANTVHQYTKHWCVISTGSATNPNSTIGVSMKKVKSIPARHSTFTKTFEQLHCWLHSGWAESSWAFCLSQMTTKL